MNTNHKKPKIALIVFPGSNCDKDCVDVFNDLLGLSLEVIWYQGQLPSHLDAVILPGGFSYGDFLRGGALASHSYIIKDLEVFVQNGGYVLGICNGFQILTEAHLLPGALLKNDCGTFICQNQTLQLNPDTKLAFPSLLKKEFNNGWLQMPIAHGEGRYFVDQGTLKELKQKGQILFHYRPNPNGSVEDIAGVMSENGRVIGMMPHPERAAFPVSSVTQDGLKLLQCFVKLVAEER